MSSHLIRKVPEITAIFWVAKLLTTAMGEATSDYFALNYNPYVAVTLGGLAFLAALYLQFKVRKYIAWVYWLAVAMVAVFGTMAADVLHVQFGIPYIATTIFYGAILIFVFVFWHKTEHTLSIHSINNPRRELFYWLTVLTTFALGTAAGDMTATTLGLGYFTSIIVFAILILLVAAAYKLFALNGILSFWLAYILTRPLGASIADWLSKSKSIGGLNWGDGTVSLIFTVLIIICVAYMSFSIREEKREFPKS